MTARIHRNRRRMGRAPVPVGMARGTIVPTASVGPVARHSNVGQAGLVGSADLVAPRESAIPDAVKASVRIPRGVKMPVGREGDPRMARRGRKNRRPTSGS